MTETVSDNVGPSLSLVHIQNAVGIIDYLSNERAFGGWETIFSVYGLRNELVEFVNVSAQKQDADTPEASAGDNVEAVVADEDTKAAKDAALTITHIQNVGRIISFAFDNGLFKGAENVRKALAVYDDFTAFLAVAAPAEEQPEGDAPTETVGG